MIRGNVALRLYCRVCGWVFGPTGLGRKPKRTAALSGGGRGGWDGGTRCKYVLVSSTSASMRMRVPPPHPPQPSTMGRYAGKQPRHRLREGEEGRAAGRSPTAPNSKPNPKPKPNPNPQPKLTRHTRRPAAQDRQPAFKRLAHRPSVRGSAWVGLRDPLPHGCGSGAYKDVLAASPANPPTPAQPGDPPAPPRSRLCAPKLYAPKPARQRKPNPKPQNPKPLVDLQPRTTNPL